MLQRLIDAPTPLAGVEQGFITSTGPLPGAAPTALVGVERRFIKQGARRMGETNQRSTPTSGVGASRAFGIFW